MHKIKIAALVLFATALAIFILQNRGTVRTVLLFTSFELPLIVLLGLTALAGFVLGLLCCALAKSGAAPKE